MGLALNGTKLSRLQQKTMTGSEEIPAKVSLLLKVHSKVFQVKAKESLLLSKLQAHKRP